MIVLGPHTTFSPRTLGSTRLGYLASSRQYGNALLGVATKKKKKTNHYSKEFSPLRYGVSKL